MYATFLAAAVAVGCLLAVQTSANLQLTRAVGTPYGAATLQLGLAAGLLVLLATVTGTIGAVRHATGVPAWQLLGGLASPLYITSGILLFPRLGALATVGLYVTGQMFASLTLDLRGLLGVPQQRATAVIGLGAVAVLAGITMIIRGQRGGPAGSALPPAPERAGWILLGILAGAALPVQGAVNAQLREAVDAPLAVALISFTVATLAIVATLAALLWLRATPAPALRPVASMPWWGWLGAACAIAYVIATFTLIPAIGAAATVALTVTGHQLTSAAIDSRGLFRMPRRPLTPQRLAGLSLLAAGSAFIQLG